MTLDRLKYLQNMKAAASSVWVTKTAAVPPPEVGSLSAIESLQFKKYLRDNSGMTAAELEEYLKQITKEERSELV